MKIAIHQPQYLPWLGYFDKMDMADCFVLLDDVQFKKNEWQNRNKIRTAEDWQWLTVPVMYKFGERINEVKIDNHRDWREKHLKSIELNYARAPYFGEYFPVLKDVLSEQWELLEGVNTFFIKRLKDILGIKTKLVMSSSLTAKSSGTSRLVEICSALGADTYISGAGGKDYLEEKFFEENGIKLEYQRYEHPKYAQVYEGFCPFMSVIDLLFCKGSESLKIIRGGRK